MRKSAIAIAVNTTIEETVQVVVAARDNELIA
jgi:hypothetical protein